MARGVPQQTTVVTADPNQAAAAAARQIQPRGPVFPGQTITTAREAIGQARGLVGAALQNRGAMPAGKGGMATPGVAAPPSRPEGVYTSPGGPAAPPPMYRMQPQVNPYMMAWRTLMPYQPSMPVYNPMPYQPFVPMYGKVRAF